MLLQHIGPVLQAEVTIVLNILGQDVSRLSSNQEHIFISNILQAHKITLGRTPLNCVDKSARQWQPHFNATLPLSTREDQTR